MQQIPMIHIQIHMSTYVGWPINPFLAKHADTKCIKQSEADHI
mgnify:CR=1 FL=1